jgi:hypothetical protein
MVKECDTFPPYSLFVCHKEINVWPRGSIIHMFHTVDNIDADGQLPLLSGSGHPLSIHRILQKASSILAGALFRQVER